MIESKKIKNPFPGLRPFETDEYRLFFGREGQSDALIARLQRSHFLAVVGTSGSGKSSLVRAGLLPALRGGLMAGAGSGWRIAIMRPGSDPIGNLASALADKDVLLEAGGGLPPAEAEAVIEATLRRGALGLVDVARQTRLADHQKLLLVVDQFEELFRFRAARAFSSTGDDASAFVKLLLEASQQREFSIYVVATMRSDFLGDCAQFQGLPEAINDGQYLIPRMTRDERRFAITGPVGVTRGKITEPLVNRLMNDVGDNPDQLPILQHALMRTWDNWSVHRLNGEPHGLEHYEAIGTMAEALSLHADEAFDILDERSRLIAEILFKTLTERGPDNREIRRPTCLKDICEIVGAGAPEVSSVVEVFRGGGRSFLMPPASIPLEPETVIDISHESLIRNWRRLKEWVKDEADSARTYRRLADAAMDYQAGARGPLDDVTLQYVLRWREKSNPGRAWGVRYHPEFDAAMGYLEESRMARDTRLAAERERERRELETARAFAEKQARSAHRMRRLTAALCLILLFALGTAAYAYTLKRSAEASKDSAVKAQLVAEGLRRDALASYASEKSAREDAQRQGERAKTEKERADTQAGIAKQRALQAEEATKKAGLARQKAEDAAASEKLQRHVAQTKAEQLEQSMGRNDSIRSGLEESQRGNFRGANAAFEKLIKQIPDLPHGASRPAGAQGLTSKQTQELTALLGWAHANIGSTHLKMGDNRAAVDAFEQARSILEESPKNDEDDPILLDTYGGLGDAYHGEGLTASKENMETEKGREESKKKSAESFRKAEQFYQSALKLQKEHLSKKGLPVEVLAPRYANLARLYADAGRFVEAEENFTLAVNFRRLRKKSRDLDSNERSALAAALRELTEFYQGREGCYDEAMGAFNDMIAVQEDVLLRDDVTLSELIDRGQEIANSYSDLAQIHAAIGEAARREAEKLEGAASNEAKEEEASHKRESDDALRMANLLQRTSFKLRQMRKSQAPVEGSTPLALVMDLTTTLDELGNVYAKFGKSAYAEKIYLEALRLREESNNEKWKSYDRLAGFYRDNKKDAAEAEKYRNRLEVAIKDNADALMQLGALHSDDPYDPTKSSEAEQYYNDAFAIYQGQSDWMKENVILFRLSRLYDKQKREDKRVQARRDRVNTMANYFKQLEMKADPQPEKPVLLVSEYLYAINALAFNNKNNDEAGAAYQRALGAFDYIMGNIDDKKVLNFYAATLEDYSKRLGKQAEAEKVKDKAKVVREKAR
jgi:energy-coupling factor transporter ATP-binding protein EcfA2